MDETPNIRLSDLQKKNGSNPGQPAGIRSNKLNTRHDERNAYITAANFTQTGAKFENNAKFIKEAVKR